MLERNPFMGFFLVVYLLFINSIGIIALHKHDSVEVVWVA